MFYLYTTGGYSAHPARDNARSTGGMLKRSNSRDQSEKEIANLLANAGARTRLKKRQELTN